MKESCINYFLGKKYPGREIITIRSILKAFKSNKFESEITQARTLYENGDYEGYEVVKGSLKSVTFSGTFHPTRSSHFLQTYSGYIVIDVDDCGSDLGRFKIVLSSDKYVHAVWISPSGNGLKFLVKTNRTSLEHKNVYRSVVHYFKENYALEVDTSGSDLARLCYVSYDSNIYINEEADSYDDILLVEDSLINKETGSEKRVFESSIHREKNKIGYFGVMVPVISVKPCHFKRSCNDMKKLSLFLI